MIVVQAANGGVSMLRILAREVCGLGRRLPKGGAGLRAVFGRPNYLGGSLLAAKLVEGALLNRLLLLAVMLP